MALEKTAAEVMPDLPVDRRGVRCVFGLAGDGINGDIEALREAAPERPRSRAE